MANHYNPNDKFIHQPFKDDPNAVGPEPSDDVTPSSDPFFARLRRDRIAEGFAFAIVQGHHEPKHVAVRSIALADALIEELDK